ncbi:hypothetical protein G7054_g12918 [Neopestalotiopsis clavispora]|nr:hypothetical protein G7054_g12918 [Neopestalotiopsis clavispora]
MSLKNHCSYQYSDPEFCVCRNWAPSKRDGRIEFEPMFEFTGDSSSSKASKAMKKTQKENSHQDHKTKVTEIPEPSTKKIKTHGPEKTEPWLRNPTLQKAKAYLDSRRSTLPRFFFRGFHSGSGGGHPGLNSKNGITPHGFLDGQTPTTMYDIGDIKSMIDGHLAFSHGDSQFSSWSADLNTALKFSGNDWYSEKMNSHIALLDTRRMEPHVEVHHTMDMFSAGLTEDCFEEEWLVYGPVTGVAFRCVSMKDISKLCFIDVPDFYSHCAEDCLMSTKDATVAAKKIGELFKHPEDQSPDVALAVAAAVLGIHFCRQGQLTPTSEVTNSMAILWSQELKSLKIPKMPTVGPSLLANPLAPSVYMPGLRFMNDLLTALEQRAFQVQAQPTPVVIDLTSEVDDEDSPRDESPLDNHDSLHTDEPLHDDSSRHDEDPLDDDDYPNQESFSDDEYSSSSDYSTSSSRFLSPSSEYFDDEDSHDDEDDEWLP